MVGVVRGVVSGGTLWRLVEESAPRPLGNQRCGRVWCLWLFGGRGEAVRPLMASGPTPTIPGELFRLVKHPDRATHLRAMVRFAVHYGNNGCGWIWPCSMVHGIAKGDGTASRTLRCAHCLSVWVRMLIDVVIRLLAILIASLVPFVLSQSLFP